MGLSLWFWGPCEVVRLELPWILVPGPQGPPSSWGWRGPVVDALHYVVANGPADLTWGVLAAATMRPWWALRHSGRAGAWVWTELAAFANALVAALLFVIAAVVALQGPAGVVGLVLWVVSIVLLSWWIAGRLGVGRGL